MKALKIVGVLLGIFVSLPIGFWSQYQILKRVEATELMWFLFWVNIPIVILLQIVAKLLAKSDA